MAIETINITGTTTGSAGSATLTARSVDPRGNALIIKGLLLSVYVSYGASTPATTDLTLSTVGLNSPSMTILTLTDTGTSRLERPTQLLDDNTGAAITDRSWYVLNDQVQFVIAQSDPDKVITVQLTIDAD